MAITIGGGRRLGSIEAHLCIWLGPVSEPQTERVPGYHIFLIPFRWIFGDMVFPALAGQAVIGALTCVVIAVIGCFRTQRRDFEWLPGGHLAQLHNIQRHDLWAIRSLFSCFP